MAVTVEQLRETAYSQLTGDVLTDASLIAYIRTLTAAGEVGGRAAGIVRAASDSIAADVARRIGLAQLRGRDTGPYTTARARALRRSLMQIIYGSVDDTARTLSDYISAEIGSHAIDAADAARLAVSYSVAIRRQIVPRDDAGDVMLGYDAALSAGSVDAVVSDAHLRWSVASPQPNILMSLASSIPIRGHMMTDWIDRWSSAMKFNVSSELTIGFAAGETAGQIADRIRNVSGLSETAARTLVRTSFSAVSATAREMLFHANEDIIREVIWVSKLDSHTTDICRALDDKRFPIGSGPRPPAHYNCRSTIAPVMKTLDEIFPVTRGPGGAPQETFGDLTPLKFARVVPYAFDDQHVPDSLDRDALRDYRSYGYSHTDRVLDRKRMADSGWRLDSPSGEDMRSAALDSVARIDRVLDRSRLSESCALYRIASYEDVISGLTQYTPESLIGHEFSVSGYCSTTTRRLSAQTIDHDARPVVVRINAPKGIRALRLSDADENEILLDRGLRFRVSGAETVVGFAPGDRADTLMLTVDIVGYSDDRDSAIVSVLENIRGASGSARRYVFSGPDSKLPGILAEARGGQKSVPRVETSDEFAPVTPGEYEQIAPYGIEDRDSRVSAGFQAYKSPLFSKINLALDRSGRPGAKTDAETGLDDALAHISGIDSGLTDSRLSRNALLYRGVTRGFVKQTLGWDVMRSDVGRDLAEGRRLTDRDYFTDPKTLVGREFSLLAYVSTSADHHISEHFSHSVMLLIRAPKGLRASRLDRDASVRPEGIRSNQEIVLDRGLRFRIADARVDTAAFYTERPRTTESRLILTLDVVGYDDARNANLVRAVRGDIDGVRRDTPNWFSDVDQTMAAAFAARSARVASIETVSVETAAATSRLSDDIVDTAPSVATTVKPAAAAVKPAAAPAASYPVLSADRSRDVVADRADVVAPGSPAAAAIDRYTSDQTYRDAVSRSLTGRTSIGSTTGTSRAETTRAAETVLDHYGRIGAIDAVIGESRLRQNIALSRGTDARWVSGGARSIERLMADAIVSPRSARALIGHEFSRTDYTSATVGATDADRFVAARDGAVGVRVLIRAPKGLRAVGVGGGEVVLDRGLRYRIVSAAPGRNGALDIEVSIIGYDSHRNDPVDDLLSAMERLGARASDAQHRPNGADDAVSDTLAATSRLTVRTTRRRVTDPAVASTTGLDSDDALVARTLSNAGGAGAADDRYAILSAGDPVADSASSQTVAASGRETAALSRYVRDPRSSVSRALTGGADASIAGIGSAETSAATRALLTDEVRGVLSDVSDIDSLLSRSRTLRDATLYVRADASWAADASGAGARLIRAAARGSRDPRTLVGLEFSRPDYTVARTSETAAASATDGRRLGGSAVTVVLRTPSGLRAIWSPTDDAVLLDRGLRYRIVGAARDSQRGLVLTVEIVGYSADREAVVSAALGALRVGPDPRADERYRLSVADAETVAKLARRR